MTLGRPPKPGPPRVKTSLMIPADLLRRLKVRFLMTTPRTDADVSALICRLIETYLDAHEGTAPTMKQKGRRR
jgi:hypothetical protein